MSSVKPPGLLTPELAPLGGCDEDPPELELNLPTTLLEVVQSDDEPVSEDMSESPPTQFQPGSAASWLNAPAPQETSEKEEKAVEPSVFRADAPAFYPKAVQDTFALRGLLGLPGSTPPSELVVEKPHCFLEPEVHAPLLEEPLPLPPEEAPPPAPIVAIEEAFGNVESSHESDGADLRNMPT
jgi:hypothetical protein